MRILDIISITFIIFVSPFRLKKTLEEMHGYFGDIEITLAKELTKVYQSVESKSTSDWINYFQKISPKGEYTLLFNSKHKD